MVIFVTAGTVAFPFRRMIDYIYDFHREDVASRIIVQSGAYQIPPFGRHIVVHQYLTQEQEIKLFQRADVVVTAAGEVSVYLAIKYARFRPIVVPRLVKLGEHVDEQQEMIAAFLRQNKAAIVLDDMTEYANAIRQRLVKVPLIRKSKLDRNDLVQSLQSEFGV